MSADSAPASGSEALGGGLDCRPALFLGGSLAAEDGSPVPEVLGWEGRDGNVFRGTFCGLLASGGRSSGGGVASEIWLTPGAGAASVFGAVISWRQWGHGPRTPAKFAGTVRWLPQAGH